MLHSPEFHVKERCLQNERAKLGLERKDHYKTKASALQAELTASIDLQKISSETNNELSKTINALQQERSELNSKLHHTNAKIELEREAIHALKGEVMNKDLAIEGLKQQLDNANQGAHALQKELIELNDSSREAVKSLEDMVTSKDLAIESLKQQLSAVEDKVTSKDLAIESLKQQLSAVNDKVDNAKTELYESKSRVESIESQFDTYKKDKEEQVSKLQNDLIKAETQNTSLSGQLASLSGNLDANVALLCQSTAELLDISRKASNAQIKDSSTLELISTRSQEIHEVLLKVKEQKQVEVDEILQTIQSTMRGKEVPNQNRIVDENNEPEHKATAFVQNVLEQSCRELRHEGTPVEVKELDTI